MTDASQTPFTAFPRRVTTIVYGSIDRLEALGDGYFQMNMLLMANIALVAGAQIVGFRDPVVFVAYASMVCALMASLSYPIVQKIGHGLGWKAGGVLLASVLMGLNSALFCGILGFLVMQNLVLKEIRKYGIRPSRYGLQKLEFHAALSEMNRKGSTHLDFEPHPKW